MNAKHREWGENPQNKQKILYNYYTGFTFFSAFWNFLKVLFMFENHENSFECVF